MRDSWDRERDPLAALAAGDPGLFEDFVRVEAPTFLAFFRRQGAAPEEAEDLTQDVFLKLYGHASSYRANERFAAFAFRIARNAWIDRTRRRAVRPLPAVGGTEGDDGPSPPREVTTAHDASEASERSEEAARLHRAMASLSEVHRSVFELGALQELSYAEVADLLDVPVGTVKSRMFYAVRRLRELLDDSSPAPEAPTTARTGGGAT